MVSVLARIYMANFEGVRNAVYDLTPYFFGTDFEREVCRQELHRALVEALHFPDLFKKARWR
jgi:hypothetical protein